MNFGTDYFQIRHGDAFLVGELIPSGDGTAWPNSTLDGSPGLEIGTAVQRSTVDAENYCAPAGGDMIGFLSKQVTNTGPSYESLNYNLQNPAKTGQAVTIVMPVEKSTIEVEGEPSKAYNATSLGLIVTTGTGAITANTAAGETVVLSLQGGRWRLAQTGDTVRGILRKQLTPNIAGNVRILVELRAGPLA